MANLCWGQVNDLVLILQQLWKKGKLDDKEYGVVFVQRVILSKNFKKILA